MEKQWYVKGCWGLFPNFPNRLNWRWLVVYRIEYDRKNEDRQPGRGYRRFLLAVCCFLLFLWLVFAFYPQGREVLRILLIPGDPDVTLHAAEVFAQELGNGFSVADAAKNFCSTVLNHGYLG